MNARLIFSTFIVLFLKTSVSYAQQPKPVTFVNQGVSFGIEKGSKYSIDEMPIFFAQRKEVKKIAVDGPTLFYTTNQSKQVLLTLPGDSILVRKGAGQRCNFVLLNDAARKNDFTTIDRLVDSLGQFATIGEGDHILPVRNIHDPYYDSMRLTMKLVAGSNAQRDSILYGYWQRRHAFIQRARESGRLSPQAADFWSRYFRFNYLSKSIMGLIYETKPLDSFPLFSSVWHNTEYLQDSTLLQIEPYRGFVVQYVSYICLKTEKYSNTYHSRMAIANNIGAAPAIKDWLLLSITQTAMALDKSSDSLITYFNTHCTNEAYRQLVADKLVFTQQSAQAAGNNVLMDRGKRMIGFADMIAAKKDSVVVIDFWATWCKPCLEEAPHFAALKKSMANQKVSFIAISLDKDRAAWLNFYPQNGVPARGAHFLLLNDFSSPLAKRFQITAIPRVMLLKGGKVLAMDAPPPSSPQLKKMIERYIGR